MSVQIGLLSLGDHLPDPASGAYAESAGGRHRAIVESAVRAEARGFHAFFVGEHHFCEYIVSAPPVVLAAVAARTTRLRLGTGVTLVANLDPVRVAEDYATVDCLSDGRVELVAGRGILAETYEAFGQAPGESRALFQEKLALLLRLWAEEDVHWSGAARPTLSGVTVHPRPAQRPHPPVWVGGGSSAASVDLAVGLGLPLMLPSVIAPPEAFLPLVERYREGWAAAGRAPAAARVGACNHVHVGATSQGARAAWRPYYLNYLSFVDRIWQRRETMHAGVRIALDYEKMLRGVAICGSPAEVTDRMRAAQETLGLDLHLVMLDLGGLPAPLVLETIDRFGEEVLPALTGARA